MKRIAALLLLVAVGFAVYFFWPKPAAPSHRLTPEGTLCLLNYMSVTTSQGVVGFPPGTMMKIIAKRSSTVVLGDGQISVEVPWLETTDDLDLAERLARNDDRTQADLAARNRAATTAAANAEKESLARMEADRQRRAAANTSAPVGSHSSALNDPTRRSVGGVSGGPTYYYAPGYGTSASYYRDVNGRQYSYDSFGNRVYR